jgi:hypothetical protein
MTWIEVLKNDLERRFLVLGLQNMSGVTELLLGHRRVG